VLAVPVAARCAETGGWIFDTAAGCKVWNPHPQPNETIRWSGACANGMAQGRGAAQWFRGNLPFESDGGEWREGRQAGYGTQVWPTGRYDGELVDGEPNGHGTLIGVRFKVMRLMLSIRESREAWHMAAAKLSDEAFSAILEAHPGLRERFASIAMAVANSGENLKEADAIEERIVEEMRLLGREAMQGWAETQVKATEREIRQQSSMHRQGKKNSAGIRNLAKSRF